MSPQERTYLQDKRGWYARTIWGELSVLGIGQEAFDAFYASLRTFERSPNPEYAPKIVRYLQDSGVLDFRGKVDNRGMSLFESQIRIQKDLGTPDFTEFRPSDESDFETIAESAYSWESEDGSLEALAALGKKQERK